MWDSLCQTAVHLISQSLHEVDNAESILKIKNLIALFMQTMNVSIHRLIEVNITTNSLQAWDFQVPVFDNFLLVLFGRYAELLKKRFSDDFQEVRVIPNYHPFRMLRY